MERTAEICLGKGKSRKTISAFKYSKYYAVGSQIYFWFDSKGNCVVIPLRFYLQVPETTEGGRSLAMSLIECFSYKEKIRSDSGVV